MKHSLKVFSLKGSLRNQNGGYWNIKKKGRKWNLFFFSFKSGGWTRLLEPKSPKPNKYIALEITQPTTLVWRIHIVVCSYGSQFWKHKYTQTNPTLPSVRNSSCCDSWICSEPRTHTSRWRLILHMPFNCLLTAYYEKSWNGADRMTWDRADRDRL